MRVESPMKTDETITTASMANEAGDVPERPPTIAMRNVSPPLRAPAGCRRRSSRLAPDTRRPAPHDPDEESLDPSPPAPCDRTAGRA